MYASGRAEEIVGAAIRSFGLHRRDDIFIVSKVLPSNASYEGTIKACNSSLCRLGVEYIDLYLLHWPGLVPFQETLDAFLSLRTAGKIRDFGVSNFDSENMSNWLELNGGAGSATNQILYNLSRRGVEWDVLPLCRNFNLPIMAYSPLEQGRLQNEAVLSQVAKRHDVQPLQIALAWVLAQKSVITIPKSVCHQHIDQNIAAIEIILDVEDHAILDRAFPPPFKSSPLEML